MGQILTIDAARAHLRVGAAVTNDMLDPLIAAAETAIEDEMGRPLIDAVDGWPDAASVPANVVHAAKLVLTDLYDNRNTPLGDLTGVRSLLQRWIKVSIG